jgi:hypothetical protein
MHLSGPYSRHGAEERVLTQYGTFFGKAARTLVANPQAGRKGTGLTRAFLPTVGVTDRVQRHVG